MDLTEADRDLLELTALQVPWYMVCGEFHDRYGSPGALARRVFELRDAGLLVVESRADAPASAEAMEADALANGCYEDLETTRDPTWTLMSTDAGFAAVEGRLSAQ